MKKIFVASNNAHKIQEIQDIIKPLGLDFEFVTPKMMDCKLEPLEDGLNYAENALIKARFYFEKYHLPTIADDSGINIDYFAGYPGIHSSRFLGNMDYKESNQFICNLMKGVSNRKAHFNCCLAYIDENGFEKVYEGIIDGKIAESPRGDKGFGYDPIFCYGDNDKTNAELGEKEKNKFSHRFIVINKWANDVKNQ